MSTETTARNAVAAVQRHRGADSALIAGFAGCSVKQFENWMHRRGTSLNWPSNSRILLACNDIAAAATPNREAAAACALWLCAHGHPVAAAALTSTFCKTKS